MKHSKSISKSLKPIDLIEALAGMMIESIDDMQVADEAIIKKLRLAKPVSLEEVKADAAFTRWTDIEKPISALPATTIREAVIQTRLIYAAALEQDAFVEMDPDIIRRIMRMSRSVLAFLEKAAEMDRMDLRGDYFVPSRALF